MTVYISSGDANGIHADRSGTQHEHGRQGFTVSLTEECGEYTGTIEFGDELDAERMARAILHRLGFDVMPASRAAGDES